MKKNNLKTFKQLSLFKEVNTFGGSLQIGRRKIARPLSTKSAIHLVLKADSKSIFNPGNRSLEKLIQQQAKKFQIKVYQMAINWSHIHAVIKIKSRSDYVKFIRALTSLLAMKAYKYWRRQNDSTLIPEKVFTLRPFTRLIKWGRDFKRVMEYQILNQLEACGLISRKKCSVHTKSKVHVASTRSDVCGAGSSSAMA